MHAARWQLHFLLLQGVPEGGLAGAQALLRPDRGERQNRRRLMCFNKEPMKNSSAKCVSRPCTSASPSAAACAWERARPTPPRITVATPLPNGRAPSCTPLPGRQSTVLPVTRQRIQRPCRTHCCTSAAVTDRCAMRDCACAERHRRARSPPRIRTRRPLQHIYGGGATRGSCAKARRLCRQPLGG